MIQFSREQIEESTRIIDLLRSGQAARLKGRAGTGKTSVLRWIVGKMGSIEALCSAPTNIATDILREKYSEMDKVYFSTTASLLKSKKKIDLETGRVWFEPTKSTDEKKFLIATDEASMLDQATCKTLQKTFPNAMFLYIGDPGQLPPIGDETFCILNELPGGELTQNFRCGQGNDLFEFIERLYQGDLRKPDLSPGRITYGNRRDVTPDMLYVTFHNITADRINQFILKKYFDGKIQKGVKLISRETFKDLEQRKIFNSERMEVDRCEKLNLLTENFNDEIAELAKEANFKKFEAYRVSSGWYEFKFSIDPEFHQFLEVLKGKQLWKAYYGLKGLFPDVRLGYATTTHCVQGITLPKVSIAWEDLHLAPPKLLQQLLYVAASRATDSIEILE